MYVITLVSWPIAESLGVKYHVHLEDNDNPESGFWFWDKAIARKKCRDLNATLKAGMYQ